jgi:two-component system, NtrC family, sensor kinase
LRGNWPIRLKVSICVGLLLLVVALLATAGLCASNAYRSLLRALRTRMDELPIAIRLSGQVGELRITLSRLRELRTFGFSLLDNDAASSRAMMCRDDFNLKLDGAAITLDAYREQLDEKIRAGSHMADFQKEWSTVEDIDRTLSRVRGAKQAEDWMIDPTRLGELDADLEHLQQLAAELPIHLHDRIKGLQRELRGQYRTLIVGTWIVSAVAALTLALFVRLFYTWVFRPLGVLIAGSRRVAGGDFDFRIHLDTRDEMAELADAMNGMTARFQAIHDDLENQVEERTRQVIRSEQLASVGFLAAGVAHEINNPLASIALCAESLEGRLGEVLDPANEQHAVVANYLRMIQSEAFRCKDITEKLLDFSRLGPARRQTTELTPLVQDVIDMLGHLGKYHDRRIELTVDQSVVAPVNPQEIKQVVLNLLVNAMDSLDEGGAVRVRLGRRGSFAELVVDDDGCGMESDVLRHVFEPFFTRRRSGQGTGLGLSISSRIVAEHGGEITATSPGRGKGSTFRVRLPLNEIAKEHDHRHQAA